MSHVSVDKKGNLVMTTELSHISVAREGNLVMTTAAELNHPWLLFGDIDPAYISFGLVQGGYRRINVVWSTVEYGHCQSRVIKRSKVKRESKRIICLDRRLVRIVAKYNNPTVDKINYFLKAAIFVEYYFYKHAGWQRIDARVI